jgi:hypothetical protein
LPGLWRGWLQGFERQATTGMERLVAGEGFAELLVQMTENVAAVSRISADVWDLALRNLRVASRADINRFSRQLARTEDKLERVLQAVEQLQEQRVAR